MLVVSFFMPSFAFAQDNKVNNKVAPLKSFFARFVKKKNVDKKIDPQSRN